MQTQGYVFCAWMGVLMNGGIAVTLLIYGWLSPHWWMLSSRMYDINPEIRVLGLYDMLEDSDPVDFFSLVDTGTLRRYNLRRRRDNVCDMKQELNSAECGIDKEDMDLLDGIEVPCYEYDMELPNPIPPAPRLTHSSTVQFEEVTSSDMRVVYPCELGAPKIVYPNCPIGYRKCGGLWNCGTGEDAFRQVRCCVNKSAIGETLFNVEATPTYVQAAGFATFKGFVKQATLDEETAHKYWCSARQFRCHTLQALVDGGRVCMVCFASALGVIVLALLLSFSRFSDKCLPVVLLMFIVGGGLVMYGWFFYRGSVVDTLKQSMTLLDKFGRPYIHPMRGYDWKNRSIMHTDPASGTRAEWQFQHRNAHVDMMTYDPEVPRGFSTIWGATFGFASGIFSFVAALFCVEVMCTKRGFSPLLSLGKVLALLLVAPVKLLKRFIDNVLAPYPVLWVYPWQKLYPKCFTCGTWLPWPLDSMYDLGLMLPVHVIRALWDYISCQDICSPQEKQVLQKAGVHNDRLQSLLCSRRSYFVMMAGLGILNFVLNVQSVIELADSVTHFRQAATVNPSYAFNVCSFREGKCGGDGPPDLEAMTMYLIDMMIKLYAIIEENCGYISVTRALIEWLGGFIGVLCACFALANWTDFATSRRFTLIGWLFMMLTPVVTSSLCENRMLPTARIEKHFKTVSVEVWVEVRHYLENQPCQDMKDTGKWALRTAQRSCNMVLAFSYFMGEATVTGCRNFQRQYGDLGSQVRLNTEICQAAVNTILNEGPQSTKEVKEWVEHYIPDFMIFLQTVVGIRSGLANVRGIVPAVMSMVPALMQGGLMVKNLVPRQTLPSILLTLPWAFTTLFWSHYQLFFQLFYGKVFLLAALAMSFGPLVYYFYGKLYTIAQPMDDQQSITLTFRIWYYALIFALLLPYLTMGLYLIFLNEFKKDMVLDTIFVALLHPTLKMFLGLVAGTLSSYAYTLQAGIDWFVDEVVDHHVTGTAPAVIAMTRNAQEAELLQERLDTTIDLDSIQEGTYVCGGLGDPRMLRPPQDGPWITKAQVYSVSLQYKDFETLDAFAAHIFCENSIPEVLSKARKSFFHVMDHPPRGAFIWDEAQALAADRDARGPGPVEMAQLPSHWGDQQQQWQQQQQQMPQFGAPMTPQSYLSAPAAQPFLVSSQQGPVAAGPPGPFPGPGDSGYWGGADSQGHSFGITAQGATGGTVGASFGRVPPAGWGEGPPMQPQFSTGAYPQTGGFPPPQSWSGGPQQPEQPFGPGPQPPPFSGPPASSSNGAWY